MSALRSSLRSLLPDPVISLYHFSLAYLGAILYGLPSRKITVIGVTGTNGKSSTAEFIYAIFEAAGIETALSNSIRIKIGSRAGPSGGRSMPGRFFIQRFLRRARRAGCTVAIVEMTSEGVKQHRHRCIELDALVFLNLAPEHIESHGSYQAYADAKFELGLSLARSPKRPRIIVANADDPEGARYLSLPVERAVGFSLAQNEPWNADERGGSFHFGGEDIAVNLPGAFNVKNALAAAELARAFGIESACIRKGIEGVANIPGRMQRIECGQTFTAIVDYALTPDALEALYKTYGNRRKVCVFGSAGGGRDKWKRPVLGKVAESYCEAVILTNDIAYGEPAQNILDEIAGGMKKKPEIIPDRRLAIRRGVELAQASPPSQHTALLVTGMGIDTEISGADGSVLPWSDAQVVREEIERALAQERV
jgi:UDP-N-acetylmuramoyl-L-alanyl-D-glutamate--2,6-diaminopimelate ligase